MTASDAPEQDAGNGIAIIGMSGRFPGAPDVARFWENIKAGTESISHFTEDQLEVKPDRARAENGTATYVRAKGILEGVDQFDARFFGYLPREAELMDPQHRVFLECAWEALESAGYDTERYRGNVGVYAGCYIDTYLLANLCAHPAFLAHLVDSIQVGSLQTELGNDKDYLATRASFKLNLRGPSMTVQTACSTSLVAICQACQSLLTYQSDMALAGGVTITFPQKKGYFYSEGGMLSADGHCRAFSDQAQGTVFSNGAGVVLLKRLSDAIADGDTIHAVIRGWALNNDGGQKHSYTAPSVDGQADVVATALAFAGVSARTIGYIEAHGTATPLGDPIEIAGLTRAFQETTSDTGFCSIGSVKTNLGHLDVASGVIGLIKTALALKEGVIPPSLHFERPNPNIAFERTPFFVSTKLTKWEPQQWPRRAGVSSFGVGGTNAHVVVEEPPARERRNAIAPKFHVLPLSAKSESALDAMATRLADHLEARPDIALADVAYTLQAGRRLFDHRRFVVSDTREGAVTQLRAGGSPATRLQQKRSAVPVAFLFPGQGAQYPGMARGLYESDPLFRSDVDACTGILRGIMGLDLRELLFASGDRVDEAAARLRATAIAQPAIFTVEYAVARAWMRRGITPDRLIGHSVGEFAAACIAGVFDLADALALVAERGRLMQELPAGDMISVRAPVDQVTSMLPSELVIAAINAPSLCVVSGPSHVVPRFTALLDEQKIAWSKLHTSHAFHSAMMEPAVEPLIRRMAGMRLSPPTIAIQSTATGAPLLAEQAINPEYWGRQLRQTVRFEEAVRTVAAEGHRIFLEAGPGQTLSTLARQIVGRQEGITVIPSMGPVQAPGDDAASMASAVGMFWLGGTAVDWPRATGFVGQRVPLPTYPFERKRFWVDPPAATAATAGAPDGVQQLIETQLQLMRQQLVALSNS